MKKKFPQNFYYKFIVKTTSVFVLFSIMLLSSSFKKSNPLRCNNFFEVKSYVNSLTLEYSSTSFKAGTFGFSDAKVSLPGGIFSWQRISSNEGDLTVSNKIFANDITASSTISSPFFTGSFFGTYKFQGVGPTASFE
jgi:hypothetical protein